MNTPPTKQKKEPDDQNYTIIDVNYSDQDVICGLMRRAGATRESVKLYLAMIDEHEGRFRARDVDECN